MERIASFLGLIVLLNLITLGAYALDKAMARAGGSRIPERRLLQLSFLGPVGAAFGIWGVRHKTKKDAYLMKFYVACAASLVAHVAVAYSLLTQA